MSTGPQTSGNASSRMPAASSEAPEGPDAWAALKAHTAARIALGRTGVSLPTAPLLEFQLAHARARDAVHAPLDIGTLEQALVDLGLPVLHARSQASNRTTYLQRPDLGRRLDLASRQQLQAMRQGRIDAAFVIADGLSTRAVEAHAVPVVRLAHATLVAWGWRVAPIVIAHQARVALGDEIGELLGARLVAIVIGERPGLSAADSLGIYLTHAPRVGRTDAERNCISNVRPGGLTYELAAHKLLYLMREAERLAMTGFQLKDQSDQVAMLIGSDQLDSDQRIGPPSASAN